MLKPASKANQQQLWVQNNAVAVSSLCWLLCLKGCLQLELCQAKQLHAKL